jgi:SSS family solute:Na+ symporter
VGYAGVAQFFPGVALGLYSKRVTTLGVFAGMVTGVVVVVVLMLSNHDPIMGLNAGFIALCFNFAVTGVVSSLTSSAKSGFEPDFASSPAAESGDNAELV